MAGHDRATTFAATRRPILTLHTSILPPPSPPRLKYRCLLSRPIRSAAPHLPLPPPLLPGNERRHRRGARLRAATPRPPSVRAAARRRVVAAPAVVVVVVVVVVVRGAAAPAARAPPLRAPRGALLRRGAVRRRGGRGRVFGLCAVVHAVRRHAPRRRGPSHRGPLRRLPPPVRHVHQRRHARPAQKRQRRRPGLGPVRVPHHRLVIQGAPRGDRPRLLCRVCLPQPALSESYRPLFRGGRQEDGRRVRATLPSQVPPRGHRQPARLAPLVNPLSTLRRPHPVAPTRSPGTHFVPHLTPTSPPHVKLYCLFRLLLRPRQPLRRLGQAPHRLCGPELQRKPVVHPRRRPYRRVPYRAPELRAPRRLHPARALQLLPLEEQRVSLAPRRKVHHPHALARQVHVHDVSVGTLEAPVHARLEEARRAPHQRVHLVLAQPHRALRRARRHAHHLAVAHEAPQLHALVQVGPLAQRQRRAARRVHASQYALRALQQRQHVVRARALGRAVEVRPRGVDGRHARQLGGHLPAELADVRLDGRLDPGVRRGRRGRGQLVDAAVRPLHPPLAGRVGRVDGAGEKGCEVGGREVDEARAGRVPQEVRQPDRRLVDRGGERRGLRVGEGAWHGRRGGEWSWL
ncbi:unnamed protein product [Chondrus crispus]|uniref:Uncharacterized protein n=1 Tax=Chondrus crispus TaxID=2769 RepID=R7QIB9_CHOCR|nr:unnamed protein product [Chondrus crispus]CDF37165.1 unnamed protein product [Chondrus crispus]|eukprot:XP_005716984.1 unnamed protein product [Chondrus crispus]